MFITLLCFIHAVSSAFGKLVFCIMISIFCERFVLTDHISSIRNGIQNFDRKLCNISK